MAAEKVWVMNGQEIVPANEVRSVAPMGHYYVQQVPVAPVQVEVPPRLMYVQPSYYVPQPRPIVIYQSTHDSGLIVAAFLALLIMLIVGFMAVLLLAWVAVGRLPWLGY